MTVAAPLAQKSPVTVPSTAMAADISGKADRVEEIRPDRNSQLRVTPIWT